MPIFITRVFSFKFHLNQNPPRRRLRACSFRTRGAAAADTFALARAVAQKASGRAEPCGAVADLALRPVYPGAAHGMPGWLAAWWGPCNYSRKLTAEPKSPESPLAPFYYLPYLVPRRPLDNFPGRHVRPHRVTISAALVMCDPVEQLELAVRVRSCSLFFSLPFWRGMCVRSIVLINQIFF